MRAFGFSRHGVPEEVLEEVLLAKPTPHGKDIVIKIKAGATNPIDFKVIRGLGTIEIRPRSLDTTVPEWLKLLDQRRRPSRWVTRSTSRAS